MLTLEDPEAGFAKLVDLLQTIFRTVQDAEADAATGESLRGSKLVYAARATAAAADSANAAAAAADAADAAIRTTGSLTINNGVANRAIAAAFQAAAAGYRATTASHRVVAAAEDLPAEAEDRFHGEVSGNPYGMLPPSSSASQLKMATKLALDFSARASSPTTFTNFSFVRDTWIHLVQYN